ncbi:hypothetical protein C1646_755057 [Rhizophagus diaphanus]|nr:hypothetical protein C1646_755057 [Rhizophagus diaphanus] [Rhizophagus sp. MUCL 43196]
MISQNTTIISKLNTLITEQKAIGDRIAKLEKNFETANNEQDFIKDIIKLIAKKLLVESIYLTHEDLRETTREFMSSKYPDFLKKFKKNQ